MIIILLFCYFVITVSAAAADEAETDEEQETERKSRGKEIDDAKPEQEEQNIPRCRKKERKVRGTRKIFDKRGRDAA